MIAAIEQHLQFIPRCIEVLVGQCAAAHPRGSIRNIDCGGSRCSRDYVEPGPGFATLSKQFASSSLETEFLSHFPGLDQLPELGCIGFRRQIRRPSYPALNIRFEKRGAVV